MGSGTVAAAMDTQVGDLQREPRPGAADGWRPAAAPLKRRRRLRVVIGASLLAFVALLVATVPLFVWPTDAAASHADAIVMFNGAGDRLHTAIRLARAHVAPNLVVSRGSQYWVEDHRCAPAIPGVTVTCFLPDPATTQGEAEFAAGLAARFHWRSIVLVTSRPQVLRAQLRMRRCFGGQVHVVSAGLSAPRWPGAVVYEWLAMGKALIWQRAC